MKEKRKAAISGTLTALGIAAVMFCIVGVVFDIINKGTFQTTGYAYTKMFLGTLGVGMGFGLPTFIYRSKKLSLGLQTLIHMGIGCVVMTIIAFLVGWIPWQQGAGIAVLTVSGEIAVAFLIWLIFYARQKRLAAEINRRLAQSR